MFQRSNEILKSGAKRWPEFQLALHEHYKNENGEKVQSRTGNTVVYLGENRRDCKEKFAGERAKSGYCSKIKDPQLKLPRMAIPAMYRGGSR